MKFPLIAAFATLTCIAPAWDGNGHAIVANIAQKQLTKMAESGDAQATKALAKLKELLAGCPEGYSSIENASVYADDIKSKTKDYSPYHYNDVEIPNFGKPWESLAETVGVVRGINMCVSVLQSKPIAGIPWGNDKSMNLMFLVHFTGDIHQPLHMGENADQGGNQTFIDLGPGDFRQQNLHFYWDDAATRKYAAPGTPEGKLLLLRTTAAQRSNPAAISAVADELTTDYAPEPDELKVSGVEVWAQESFKLAHDVAYKFDLTAGTTVMGTKNGQEVKLGTKYVVPAEYKDSCTKVGLHRIVLAGYRLANQLRDLLGS